MKRTSAKRVRFDSHSDSDMLWHYRLIIPLWVYYACLKEFKRVNGYSANEGVRRLKAKLHDK